MSELCDNKIQMNTVMQRQTETQTEREPDIGS